MIKTNKSYAKRLKVTKNGKILGRSVGQNHFNAKESRRSQLKKKNNLNAFHMTAKEKSRFLVNL
ncbi:MAG: 50S ribosomal protein L35 [Candidatus Pacebacteria bacterium]|jgi:ribosomal protein L35|nr:50S ribosomal protein L35 [Candidatus Paceibacterota bacterium]